MPKITYKNEDFYLRWPKESDWIILDIGRRYGSWKLFFYKKTNEYRRLYVVDWLTAKANNEIKDLPNCTLLQLAKRYGYLKQFYSDPNFNKKRNLKNNKIKKRRGPGRLTIWKDIDSEFKLAHGHKPRSIWTEKQKTLLLAIAKDHTHTNVDWKKIINDPLITKLPSNYHSITRLTHYYQHLQNTNHSSHLWTKTQINILFRLSKKHTKSEIDWVTLIQDSRIKQLPDKYTSDIHHLRKYYWNVARKDRKSQEFIKKHRADALKWKKENKKQYKANQKKRSKLIKTIVNKFLNAVNDEN